MRFYIRISCLALFLAMACGATQIRATEDSDEQKSTATLTILPAFRLQITDQVVSETLSANPGVDTAFNAGFIELTIDKPTLAVSANKGWKLTVKSSGFTGPYAKAIGDLQLKDAGSGHVTMSEFRSLSATDQEMATDSAGVSNESHPCQYKILLDWTKDIPGTYEAIVIYTISTSGRK